VPSVILDTNLIVLFVVGLTRTDIIEVHDNLSDYTITDYVNLSNLLNAFSDIILLPHVLAEVSSLSRQIKNPYRTMIQNNFRKFVELNGELSLPSIDAVRRNEFLRLGITDSAILNALDVLNTQSDCVLFTVDGDLAIEAEMLGHHVLTLEALRG